MSAVPGVGPLHGKIFEAPAEGWFVTTAGLEYPATGFLLASREFPPKHATASGAVAAPVAERWPSPPVAGMPDELWRRVLERAGRHLPWVFERR